MATHRFSQGPLPPRNADHAHIMHEVQHVPHQPLCPMHEVKHVPHLPLCPCCFLRISLWRDCEATAKLGFRCFECLAYYWQCHLASSHDSKCVLSSQRHWGNVAWRRHNGGAVLHTVHCATNTNPVNIRRHTRNACASLVRLHPVTAAEIRTHMSTNVQTETTYIPTSGRTGTSLFVLVFAGSAGMTIKVSSDQGWPCSSRHRAITEANNTVQRPRKRQFL